MTTFFQKKTKYWCIDFTNLSIRVNSKMINFQYYTFRLKSMVILQPRGHVWPCVKMGHWLLGALPPTPPELRDLDLTCVFLIGKHISFGILFLFLYNTLFDAIPVPTREENCTVWTEVENKCTRDCN